MPDKPKRRKNNKNKRKNKGQNQQNNSTQPGDVSATELVSCDEKVLEIPSQIEKEAVNLNTEFSKTNTEVKCENLVKKLETSREENTEVITTDISSVDTTEKNPTNKGENKYVNNINKQQHVIVVEKYKVESPEKTIRTKLQGTGKSKSVDNDDQPTIVEILDDEKLESCSSAILVDACNVLITEAEPEVQWESTSDLKDMKPMLLETTVPGALSITTIPLITAHCERTKSMSPEEERTLRKYLQTLNLSTNEASTPKIVEIKTEIEHNEESEIKKRLKNKGVMENIFIPRPGPARSLHVIDEEVSGESSTTSRRHSYLNDKKDETEELEDDVFISSEDVKRKVTFNKDFKTFSNLIPQECYRVGAQIRDPEISEARGAWTTTKLESLTGAEIVYLTDSSSSTSSTYDINENEENNYKSDENVRIITPTIEVINTDNFLKNNYAYNNENCNTDQKLNEDKNTKIKENNFKDNHEISHIKTSREHEIVVLDTDKIETNLYVKEIDNSNLNKNEESKSFVFKDNVHAKKDVNPEKIVDEYDLEIKVLKCELNDAINHLIKEVISDSESANDDVNESLVRQDSSSSIASSQCTAKYNPKCSSLNDISVVESDDFSRTRNEFKQSHDEKSHVMDVIKSIRVDSLESNQKIEKISSLRDICLKKISDLPYGEQIIEELAKVSERLQKLSDISTSNTLQYTTSNSKQIRDKNISTLISNVSPPPIKPRNSSLKINQEDSRTTLPAQDTSKAYNICLSPSQKMLMEKTKTKLEVVDEKPFIVEQKEKIDVNTQAKDIIKPLDVPFKSQTGSRLLALLQSPSRGHTESKEFNFNKTNKSYETSNNLFSKLNDTNIHDSVNRTFAETPFNGTPKAIDRTNLFKPIPPPKPRNFSSSFYDSHNSSFIDNSFKSIKTENKYFHYSTGNLSKDIEEDISSIQNMHRYYNDIYKQAREDCYPRRPSLPKDLCDQQMEYILQKEKEVEAEINRLENDRIRTTQRRGPRAPMISDDDIKSRSAFDLNNHINRSYSLINTILQPSSKLETGKLSSVFSKSEEELVRNKMYTEYVSQMAEREQRKHQKVIKITKTPLCLNRNVQSKSESQLKLCEQKVNNRIEKEFIDKARERWNKLGFKDPDTEDEKDGDQKYKEPQVIEHKIKVIDSGEEKDVQKLPNHLQDFVKFTVKDKSDKSSSPGESDHNEASSHGVIVCAVIIILLTIIKYIVRLFR